MVTEACFTRWITTLIGQIYDYLWQARYLTCKFFDKQQFENLTWMNINKKINAIINVQLMIINVQNNARSAPKLKR